MKIDGLKILVTGGAGFIGSHIVEDLVNQGANVTIYDNFSSGSMENIKLRHPAESLNLLFVLMLKQEWITYLSEHLLIRSKALI